MFNRLLTDRRSDSPRPWLFHPRRESAKVSARLLFLTGLIVAAGIAAWAVLGHGGEGDGDGEASFEVARGPLRISTTVSGEIKPKEQLVISSELEGQNSILFVQPEGTRVKQGDLLVELDSSSLEDRRVDQEIKVGNDESELITARENLEVVKSQVQSDIEQAELDLEFAEQDLLKYNEGELPREIKAAESTITLAEEELRRAEDKHNWSKVLFEEKYLSQTELRADELSANKARLDLELAQTDLELLLDFTRKRKLLELESGVRQARQELDRVRRTSTSEITHAAASLEARKHSFEREKAKLEKIDEQLTKAKIHAPMDGLVIYATSTGRGFRGGQEPLAEGQSVHERQQLIHLPTTDSYIAEASIHESVLDKLKPGLPVRITIDALPGKAIAGRVESIAPLPDSQNSWMNPDLKVYDTKIVLEGTTQGIRSGMSCQAEIIMAEYPDALYIPIQAVIKVNGIPTVYVRESGGWEPRAVDTGLDNNRMVHVISGLEEGERVLLTPPLQAGEIRPSGEGEVAADSESGTSTGEDALATGDEGKSPGIPATGEPSGMSTREAAPAMEERRVNADSEGGAPDAESMRRRFESMSPEEREALRKRFESMTPEQREAMRKQFGAGRPGGSPRNSDAP